MKILNKQINKILIVKLSSIGDVVHSLPTLKALRDTFPKAYIAWIVEEKSKDVILGNPLIDEVIIFEKERWKKELFKTKTTKESLKEIINFAKFLRSKNFDLAIDLQGLIRSGLIAYFSGAKIRVGYRRSRELSYLFYNFKINKNQQAVHAVESYLHLAKSLGADIKNIEFPFFINDQDKKFAENFLIKNFNADSRYQTIIVGINPGASLSIKRWDKIKFAQLADKLQNELKVKVIIFGGFKDLEVVEEVKNLMKTKPIDAAGKTNIKQLAALIKNCSIFVGNDTGPLHIAVALGIPTVALFGPDNPYRTGPYGKMHTIIYKNFSCSPCIRNPICKDFPCMQAISVEEVFEVIRNKLIKENIEIRNQKLEKI